MKRRTKTDKKQQTRTVETRDLSKVQGGGLLLSSSYYTTVSYFNDDDYGDRSGG